MSLTRPTSQTLISITLAAAAWLISAQLHLGEQLFAAARQSTAIRPEELVTPALVLAVSLIFLAKRQAGQLSAEVARLRTEATDISTARYDPLTGLPNRQPFLAVVKEALAANIGRRSRCAVLVLDVVGLQAVNDRHGPGAGDAMLVEVACRLRSSVRDIQHLARIGDGQFGFLVDYVFEAGAPHEFARELLSIVQRPMQFGTARIDIAAAVGLAVGPDQGSTVEDLLHAAEMAVFCDTRIASARSDAPLAKAA